MYGLIIIKKLDSLYSLFSSSLLTRFDTILKEKGLLSPKKSLKMSAVPPIFFKVANLTVGSLCLIASISQLSYLFSNFNASLLAIFGIILSVPIIYLEFKVPPNLYKFASFYFSFLGRGLAYILLSLLVNFGGVFKILTTLLTFLLGVSYCVFQVLPQIEEPANFRSEGSSIAMDVDDDDDII